MRIITDPQAAAQTELVRRGKAHFDDDGNFVVGGGTKSSSAKDRDAAIKDGTMGLSGDQLWELSGFDKPATTRRKAPKANKQTVAKTTQHLVKTDRAKAIRAFCLNKAGFDTPEWDNVSYRALMDQAGVPRRVKGGEKPKVKVSGRNTVGNTKRQAAFAKANGITA